MISALEKHARMAQAAVDFAREKGRGQLFTQAMVVLTEATRALDHVRQVRSSQPTRSQRGAAVPPSRADA